jgi:hypothetical protein
MQPVRPANPAARGGGKIASRTAHLPAFQEPNRTSCMSRPGSSVNTPARIKAPA